MRRPSTFSVAMCTYEGERFLAEQLDSIAAQERLPDELVVCDDGSTDGTVHMLRSFAAASPFPVEIHVNQRRLGPARNFETAIGLCRGDLIALADQDDVWRPHKLRTLEAAFAGAAETDAFFTDGAVVGKDSRPLGYSLWEGAGFTLEEQRAFGGRGSWRVLLHHSVATGATMALRGRARDDVLPVGSGWLHDAWIAFLLAARGRLGLVRERLILYRHHGGNRVGMEPRRRTALGKRVVEARRTDRGFYADQSARYRVLLERLSASEDVEGSVIRAVRDKQDHLATRANMPSNRGRRVMVALRELPRYRRWSPSGWKSAVKDVFLRP